MTAEAKRGECLMDRAVYERMDALEATHWWFAARRDIIRAIIERHVPLPEDARVLEAGCGTGGNLQMLSEFGHLDAFEYDAAAREAAERKSGMKIPFGALPDDIPFDTTSYHMIGLFDVLEHIEQDLPALKSLGGRLAPDGRIVVTVPAFPWLWSKHDERHHHFRRYTKASLSAVAEAAGLEVERSFYFNSFLFPAAVGARAAKAIVRSDTPDDARPAEWVNSMLYNVFSFEKRLVGRVPMPAGLSLGAVLVKG